MCIRDSRRTVPFETINDVICQKVRIGMMPVYQADLNGFAEEIKQYNLQYLMLFEAIQIYAIVSKTCLLYTSQGPAGVAGH